MRSRQLKDGEELDLICWQEYGDLPGSLEAVLRENWDRLNLFDRLGRVCPLSSPQSIILPDLARPTGTTPTPRLFD